MNSNLSNNFLAVDKTSGLGWMVSRLPRGICRMSLVSFGTAVTILEPRSTLRIVSSIDTDLPLAREYKSGNINKKSSVYTHVHLLESESVECVECVRQCLECRSNMHHYTLHTHVIMPTLQYGDSSKHELCPIASYHLFHSHVLDKTAVLPCTSNAVCDFYLSA